MHLVTDAENNDAGYFTDGPPGTVVNANFLNTVLKEIKAVIEAAGMGLSSAESDTNTQLLSALTTHFYPSNYDRVVKTQTEFNALFTRTGASAYVIANGIRSVYIRNTGVAYACYGPTSFLSGGDTYALISTNECCNLICDPGAYFYFEDTAGSVICNTANSTITNLWVRGLGTTAVSVTDSILVSANNIKLYGCRVTNRKISGATQSGFRSLNALSGSLQEFNTCSVEDIETTGTFVGFNQCSGLSNCSALSFSGGAGTNLYGFYGCFNLSNSRVDSFATSGTGSLWGFYGCGVLSMCAVSRIESTGSGVVYGFDTCQTLSACSVTFCIGHDQISSGFLGSDVLSACSASVSTTGTGSARAINSCNYLSACNATASTVGGDAYAFWNCGSISACVGSATAAGGGDEAYGFHTCVELSACKAGNVNGTVAEGFHNCVHGAAIHTLKAVNAGNTYMDSADAQIVVKYSIEQFFT